MSSLNPALEEALEVRAFVPSEIPWKDLAFWSDERALRDDLDRTGAHTAAAGASPPVR